MAQPTLQSSFNSGEWAPQLFSRVDVEKFHSGAALLRNFFVDYRGGASTRAGTKYLAAAKFSNKATRLIPFQITSTVGYILEFGDFYIRFYQGGSQVLLAGVPYEIVTPYAAADLALLKFAQNVNQMILCHPNYQPRTLTFTSATSWALAIIAFGSTVSKPTGLNASTTLSSGQINYAYVVTAVDVNGQESAVSAAVRLTQIQNLSTTAGTNTISWTPVTGAVSYNVYKANSTVANPVPLGVPYGFIGNVTAGSIADSNITPDFSQSPPTQRNPFTGGGSVVSTTITAAGSYAVAPTLSFSAPTGAGTTAVGYPLLHAQGSVGIVNGGNLYVVNDTITFDNGVVLTVDTISGSGAITAVHISTAGSAATLPANPVSQISTSGSGVSATFNFDWGIYDIVRTNSGGGYTSAPSITFSAGAATATSTVGAITFNNPSIPAFFQQRLVLAAPSSAPQTMYFSQTGNYFNFDVHEPIQDDDAITASIISGQLNTIKSMVAQPAGLIVLTDSSSWLINGGSFGLPITPSSIAANAQSFNGANDMPPIVVVYDMLYAQSKGSAVRDSLYNFYANVYTGADISILSSHLFFGYSLSQWAWAEEPFKVVWAVRNDGKLLGLTFLKEQDFTAWTHHDTSGTFESVATVVESTAQGYINGLYLVVDRTINGSAVKYIERMADRYMPNGAADAWCVDAGLQYSGAPATNFSGGAHLANATVTGLANGIVIPPFVMAPSGNFTLSTAASKVTVGLAYTPDLQTLPLDLGNPTVQSKQKKVPAVTARVAETLGLEVGTDVTDLVVMKDLVVGNVGSMTNAPVTDLVNGDARTFLDPKFSDYAQYYFRQPYPFPATILGVFPQIAVGDTPKGFGLDKKEEAA